MPIVRSKLTGKYYNTDTGEEVSPDIQGMVEYQGQKFPISIPKGPSKQEKDIYEAKTQYHGLKNQFSELTRPFEYLSSAAPVVGGIMGNIAGGFSGGPIGSYAGGIAGAGAGSLVESLSRNVTAPMYGREQITPGEMALSATGDMALQGIGDKLFSVGSKVLGTGPQLRTALLRKMGVGSDVTDQGVKTFLSEHPNIPVSASDVSRNPFLSFLETLAPFTKRKQVGEVGEQLGKEFRGRIASYNPEGLGPGEIGLAAREGLEGGLSDFKGMVAKEYDTVRNIASLNPYRDSTGKLILDDKGKPILGPIFGTRSQSVAKEELGDINTEFTTSLGAQRDAFKTLGDIQQGKFPISFDKVLQLKTALGNKAYTDEMFKGLDKVRLMKVARALDEDIERSISGNISRSTYLNRLPKTSSGWVKGNKSALESYRTGKRIAHAERQIFEDAPINKRLIEGGLSGQNEIQAILKDPVAIDDFLKGSRSKIKARNQLKAQFLTDILQASEIPAESVATEGKRVFRKNVPISTIESPGGREIFNKLFSQAERKDLEYFFKTIQHLDPKVPMTGTTAVAIRAGSGALAFNVGLVSSMLSGNDLSSSAKMGGLALGAVLSGSSFAKRVMLNPKIARYAANLAKLPPNSPQANLMSKALFLGLKGVQLDLTTPEGVLIGTGTINSSGKIVPDRFE